MHPCQYWPMPDGTDRSSATIELADLVRVADLADLADDAEAELFGLVRHVGR